MNEVYENETPKRRIRTKDIPARTLEGRENQLINQAVNLVERKLKDGTASSQIISILLQAGMTKTRLENEKLKSDLAVAQAKIKQMESQETSKDLYEEAIKAFKSYTGQAYEEDEDDDC